MGRKPAFGEADVSEIKRLYLEEGKSCREIAKTLQKGTGSSVRNALLKAGVDLAEVGSVFLQAQGCRYLWIVGGAWLVCLFVKAIGSGALWARST